MITVAGTKVSPDTGKEVLNSNSNYSTSKVDIAAPGTAMYTTKKTNE